MKGGAKDQCLSRKIQKNLQQSFVWNGDASWEVDRCCHQHFPSSIRQSTKDSRISSDSCRERPQSRSGDTTVWSVKSSRLLTEKNWTPECGRDRWPALQRLSRSRVSKDDMRCRIHLFGGSFHKEDQLRLMILLHRSKALLIEEWLQVPCAEWRSWLLGCWSKRSPSKRWWSLRSESGCFPRRKAKRRNLDIADSLSQSIDMSVKREPFDKDFSLFYLPWQIHGTRGQGKRQSNKGRLPGLNKADRRSVRERMYRCVKEDDRRMTLTREEEILDDYPLFCGNSAFEAVQRGKRRTNGEDKAENHGVQ